MARISQREPKHQFHLIQIFTIFMNNFSLLILVRYKHALGNARYLERYYQYPHYH